MTAPSRPGSYFFGDGGGVPSFFDGSVVPPVFLAGEPGAVFFGESEEDDDDGAVFFGVSAKAALVKVTAQARSVRLNRRMI